MLKYLFNDKYILQLLSNIQRGPFTTGTRADLRLLQAFAAAALEIHHGEPPLPRALETAQLREEEVIRPQTGLEIKNPVDVRVKEITGRNNAEGLFFSM